MPVCLAETAQYTRTLKSQFSVFQMKPQEPPAGTPPVPARDTSAHFFAPCTRYLAPAGASEAERVLALEQATRCASSSGSAVDFSKAGFGAANQYQVGDQVSWTHSKHTFRSGFEFVRVQDTPNNYGSPVGNPTFSRWARFSAE